MPVGCGEGQENRRPIEGNPSGITRDMLDELIRRNETQHMKRLEELLSEYDLGGISLKAHLLQGGPGIAQEIDRRR